MSNSGLILALYNFWQSKPQPCLAVSHINVSSLIIIFSEISFFSFPCIIIIYLAGDLLGHNKSSTLWFLEFLDPIYIRPGGGGGASLLFLIKLFTGWLRLLLKFWEKYYSVHYCALSLVPGTIFHLTVLSGQSKRQKLYYLVKVRDRNWSFVTIDTIFYDSFWSSSSHLIFQTLTDWFHRSLSLIFLLVYELKMAILYPAEICNLSWLIDQILLSVKILKLLILTRCSILLILFYFQVHVSGNFPNISV